MSSTKKEYDVLKGLLDGSQVNSLDRTTILGCLQEKTLSDLGSSKQLYVLHDPCDIRKPYSSDLEDIGTVLSLKKEVIAGYSSFNSVVLKSDSQQINLLDTCLYSNKQANYVRQEICHQIFSNHASTEKQVILKDKKGKIISAECQDLVLKDTYQNGSKIAKNQIIKSSKILKSSNSEVSICHVLDREFDDISVFETINDLSDKFVIRIKLSRLSNAKTVHYTPKGKVSKKESYEKLVDKKFAKSADFLIEKLEIKGKVLRNVNCLIEYETLILNKKTYSVVRISLTCAGKPLFEHPMLLITNEVVSSPMEAQQIYKTYILRFKIELVFRFLKVQLGWESFQVRDFNSIANLLALVFYLVGYFKELEDILIKHPLACFICKLAFSKGKVTVFFLLEGIQRLIAHQQVQIWIKEENISQEDIEQILLEFNQNQS